MTTRDTKSQGTRASRARTPRAVAKTTATKAAGTKAPAVDGKAAPVAAVKGTGTPAKATAVKAPAAKAPAAKPAPSAKATAPAKAVPAAFTAFEFKAVEVPEIVRTAAEKSIENSRQAYDAMRDMSEEAVDVLEATIDTVRKGVIDMNSTNMDLLRAHADASMTFFKSIAEVRSVSEAMDLHVAFTRDRTDAMVEHSRAVTEQSKALAEDLSAPVKTAVEKNIKRFKAA